jgi:hypothetical protein
MYDLLTGHTIGEEDEDLTLEERQQQQARIEADAQLSLQSGGSRAAARWAEETAVSSGAKSTHKRRSEKLPNPVDVIPSKVAPPPTQKRSSKEQESAPIASSSHRAEPSRKLSTKAPPPTQKHLSMEPKSAPAVSSSRRAEPSRKSSTKALPPTQKRRSMEPEPAPTASSSNRPKPSRKSSTKVPKSAPMIVDSNSDNDMNIPPPTQKRRPMEPEPAPTASSSNRPKPSRKSSTKVPKSAPMIVDSNSDNDMNIPPPTRKESGTKTNKTHSKSSAPRNAPDRTSSSKPQKPAPAPSKTLDPDVKQAVLLDIQAIVARHIARAAASREEFGGKVDEESISGDSAHQDDGDVVMVDRNQEELSSEEEMVTQESPQIPPMSEKQKGKQRDVDSAGGSLDDIEMRDVDDELTGLGASLLVGDLSTSSGFLSIDDQSFNEDRDMEYEDEELGVVGTLDDGTGPSPWTTDGSASRPDSPRDVDDEAPSNQHAPRTPQAGQRRNRQFFSGTSHSFLNFIFNN